jgi:IS5 family transposase
VHDSQKLPELIDEKSEGEILFADSVYKSKQTDERLDELGVGNYIHEKAWRNRPLSEIQKRMNRLKSGIRCRVEHIFGLVANSMGGPELEYIGIKRIGTAIGPMNLVCNLVRYGQLKRQGRARAGACPA